MIIEFQKLYEPYDDIEVPAYATVGSAGCDLKIHNFKEVFTSTTSPNQNASSKLPFDASEIYLLPHSRLLVGCGFAVALPPGYVMDVRSRGGYTLKRGLIVANSPGTVDCDYRGEICVILLNTSEFAIKVRRYDKIAQGIILQYDVAIFRVVNSLSTTVRGEGAFGSTDKVIQ